jgi:hypothetical protein
MSSPVASLFMALQGAMILWPGRYLERADFRNGAWSAIGCAGCAGSFLAPLMQIVLKLSTEGG